jgi:hypothetical protein
VPTAVVDNAVPPIAASSVRRFNSVAIVSSSVKAWQGPARFAPMIPRGSGRRNKNLTSDSYFIVSERASAPAAIG